MAGAGGIGAFFIGGFDWGLGVDWIGEGEEVVRVDYPPLLYKFSFHGIIFPSHPHPTITPSVSEPTAYTLPPPSLPPDPLSAAAVEQTPQARTKRSSTTTKQQPYKIGRAHV